LQGDEFSVDAIVKTFLKNLDAPPFSLPRHNLGAQLLTELPDELLSARFVWLRRNGVVPPLLCPAPMTAPTPSCGVDPASSPSGSGRRDEIVSVSRFKACREVDATPGSP
jgi:hypothetical protein